jgi:hypothetical protein
VILVVFDHEIEDANSDASIPVESKAESLAQSVVVVKHHSGSHRSHKINFEIKGTTGREPFLRRGKFRNISAVLISQEEIGGAPAPGIRDS